MVPVIAPVVLTLAAIGAVLIFLICLVSLWMDRMGAAKAACKPSPTPAVPERLRRSRKEAEAARVKAQYGDFKRSKS
jgi:hypothetical protein